MRDTKAKSNRNLIGSHYQATALLTALSLACSSMISCTKKPSELAEDSSTSSLSALVISELQSELENSATGSSYNKIQKSKQLRSFSVALSEEQIQAIVGAATNAVTAAGLDSSSDLIALLPEIAKGAEDKLDEVSITDPADKMALINAISRSLIKSTKNRESFLPSTSALNGHTPMETVLNRLSDAVIGSLDEAGLSASEVPDAAKGIMSTMVGTLGDTDATTSDLKNLMESLTSGAVDGLDEITLTNYDASVLPSLVMNITEGATMALDDISMADYSSTNLPDLVAGISAGATMALDDIVMTGYDSSTLPQMISSITAGSTAALGDITMAGYDITDLSMMVNQISAGATSSLDDITMTGYDSSNLPTMIESITAGSTGALDQINPSMTGYDATVLPDLVENISGGAVASLDNITMTGYDSTQIANMITYASSGATAGLADISMTGFDSSDIQTMITAISTGATEAISDVGGNYAITSDAAIQALAEGVALGVNDITDNYPTATLDSTSLANYIESGAELTTDGYTAPTLTTAVSTGLSAPLSPSWGYFMDYNSASGVISGFVHIGPAGNETDVESYRIYLGTDMTTKAGAALTTIPKTGQPILYDLPATSSNGATFILIYVVKTGGIEEAVPFAAPFMDMQSSSPSTATITTN